MDNLETFGPNVADEPLKQNLFALSLAMLAARKPVELSCTENGRFKAVYVKKDGSKVTVNIVMEEAPKGQVN